MLRRNEEPVSLTPKTFDLLAEFVRRPGRVLDRAELMKAVWPNSFVEDGNLAFNIRQLRKALGDDAQSPKFIETVPRRGYRFIAEVEEIPLEPESRIESAGQSRIDQSFHPRTWSIRNRFSVGAAAIVLSGVIGLGMWYLSAEATPNAAPILSLPFSSEKLTTTGTVFSAAISPDGKKVVYSNQIGGKESVWLRDLDTGNNVEIVPASDHIHHEFVFSADGSTIYFGRGDKAASHRIDIYRVSVFGGIPEKIAGDTEGWISVSAEEKKISFVRCPRLSEEYCSLWVADAEDGKNERKLASSMDPIRIADHEISPDGTRIAFAVGQSRNQGNEFRLAEVEIDSGTQREITPERFFNIKSLTWLPDQSGLLITASRIPNKHFRIWQVSVATGNVVPITKDPETYSMLSLDKAAARLVSTQIKQDFHLYRFNIEKPSERVMLADATNASASPDGKIYFTSLMSGNDEIWRMNADGSEPRQLTNVAADDRNPIVSPNGKTVYFTSNRTGEAQVWRMNSDGSNQEQVTQKEGGYPVFVSTDGRSVYYQHGIHGTLWRVSAEKVEEQVVLNKAARFVFSPDGSLVAVAERLDNGFGLSIVSPTDGRTVDSLTLPKEKSRLLQLSWYPDAKSLLYIMSDLDYRQNSLYRHALSGGLAQRIADLGNEEISEVSGLSLLPDGKSFVLIQGGWKHDAVLFTGLK